MSSKPTPVVVTEVCSLCGLDWRRHGKNPTSEKCIELLLAEVRALNAQLAVRPISYPVPYPQPYPVPYPVRPVWPSYPMWRTTGQPYSSTASNMPTLSSTAPRAISASAIR